MLDEKIARRKLSHAVLERLQERLRAGEWQAGDALPSERDLMVRFSVGRPAVREALQTLAHSGIIEIAHGGRARVRLPTAQSLIEQIAGGAQHLLRSEPSTLTQLKEARGFLEAGLARMAAERAKPEDIRRLRAALAAQEQALADLDRFIDADMEFHRSVAVISGNPIFPAIVEAMFGWAKEFYATIVRAPGAEALTLAEHGRIIDCIARQDCTGAEQAMREHLLRANQLYREIEQAR